MWLMFRKQMKQQCKSGRQRRRVSEESLKHVQRPVYEVFHVFQLIVCVSC